MSSPRFSSFSEFFPYYLGEHRHPTCRTLHFFGTAGFLAIVGAALWSRPTQFGLALVGILVLGIIGNVIERRRNAAPVLLAMVVAGAVAQPWMLVGIAWAYLFAWIGHFKVEHNRPATFTYPLWSLLGDFKMWSMMARGRLWSGDPVDELGLNPAQPDD